MKTQPHAHAIVALLVAWLFVACDVPVAPHPTPPADASFAKGGKPGGGDPGEGTTRGGSVVQGDLLLAEGQSAIASTCPTPHGFGSGNGWALVYGKTGCLIVGGLRSVAVDTAYAITDDVVIGVQIEKGKNGRITHIRLRGQDVDGADGILHDTGWIAVAEPVVPTTAGFTLHVHALDIPVWRWDSHLERGGNRVEIVGTINIGDVVYPAQ